MAGMFYSLKEAAEKLQKTEAQVKELVKERKLREFRDGSNLLFKMDEVESLIPETDAATAEESSAPAKEPKRPKRTKKQPAAEQPQQEPGEAELPAEPLAEAVAEPPDIPKQPEEPAGELLEEPPEGLAEEPAEGTSEAPAQIDEDEILLAHETGTAATQTPESELTDADTALTGEGINVLGESDKDFELTDDTLAETTSIPGMLDASAEASAEIPLEEIEDDVNLDSFGSGSGLLDLSLQADDTSLGGILDEIYTSEGGEEQPPAEAGTAEEFAAEAEHILSEETPFEPEPMAVPPVPIMAQAYAQAAPDTLSKALGILLFLPLLVFIYTAIIAVAGLREVMPSILEPLQGFIWYILIGAVVATALVVVAALLVGSKSGTSAKKAEKPKKQKKVKKSRKKAKVAETAAEAAE